MTSTPHKLYGVVVVDDSASFRAALVSALERNPELKVMGEARTGREAIELVNTLKPDVVTMDVVMPEMSGIDATRTIMELSPVPVLLLTTLARSEEQTQALHAMKLGVVDVVAKPSFAAGGEPQVQELVRRVRAMAEVRVVRRRTSVVAKGQLPRVGPREIEVVAVATSTGGPPALERLFAGIPRPFPPVVVAQHLAPSFAQGFARWLQKATGRKVVTVTRREALKQDVVYVAGEQAHLLLSPGHVESLPAGVGQLAPDANMLLRSAATSYGDRAVGVVLTGMGRDGAEGLLAMKLQGAWTIAQDEASSVVYGMPRVALEVGASCEVLGIDDIPIRLVEICGTTLQP